MGDLNDAWPPALLRPVVVHSKDIRVTIWTAGLKYVGTGGLRLDEASDQLRKQLIGEAREADGRRNVQLNSHVF